MGANMFELMVVIVLAIILNSNQFSNFILERSKGVSVVDVNALNYYGGKIREICNDTNGTCSGIDQSATMNLPANSPAIASIYAQANAYWQGTPASVNESVAGTPYTLTWAAGSQPGSNAFVLNDPQGFLPEQVPDVSIQGSVSDNTIIYLHYDSCMNGVYASSTAAPGPTC